MLAFSSLCIPSHLPQATLAAEDRHFEDLMSQLLQRFSGPAGARLLQSRGSLIVCRLAALLGGQRVFCQLAAVRSETILKET